MIMNLNAHHRLGEILVADGLLDNDVLDGALAEQQRSGGRIGEILIKMGLIGEEDVKRALSTQLGIPFQPLTGYQVPADALSLMPARMVNHYRVVPLKRSPDTLTVAMEDALDIRTIDDLRMHLKLRIEPVFATAKDIHNTIKRYYGIGADTVEGMMEGQSQDGGADVVELRSAHNVDLQDMSQDASIVRFVNQLILEAIDDRATDIHVEPLEDDLQIRYRIDGLLYEAQVPPEIRRFQSSIISRLKIMADLNIAERRLPQDGKIVIRKGDQDFDLRVSTVPTPYGESIVLRILSRNSSFVSLEKVGFQGHHLTILRHMISRPHGIVLVTGPTGSGKSTTLYASLSEINTVDKKIITIEDPIEYRIAGVTQIQVQPQIGLTFAAALRTILRQDPDVIMVGETRDTETAQITIRTALTGHLVFSTLHTNDACSAVTRLLDMGIEPFLISSSIEGLLAQRLVRVLCKHCKQRMQPDLELLKRVNVTGDDPESLTIFKQRGCEKCRYTGFAGRTAVYEIVQITEEFRRLVVDRAPANILKRHAVSTGMRPLRHDGWEKVKAGITTIDEVLRVTMEDEILTEEVAKPAVVQGAALTHEPEAAAVANGPVVAAGAPTNGGSQIEIQIDRG